MERVQQAATNADEDPYRDHDAALHVQLDADYERRFREGYQSDPYFRERWQAADSAANQQYKGQCFTRSSRGLLFLRVDDEPPRLCVPRSEVPALIARYHDSAFEAAHEG
ncbi:hypothetical protein FA95DRAFT_1498894, partial [Auriscalpium vulgare]